MSGLLSVCPWVHVELSKRNAWILCIWSSHMRSIHLSTYADVYRESYLLCDCIFPWVKAKWWEWDTRCDFLSCCIRLNKWTLDRSEGRDRECKCDNRDESFHNWKVKVNIPHLAHTDGAGFYFHVIDVSKVGKYTLSWPLGECETMPWVKALEVLSFLAEWEEFRRVTIREWIAKFCKKTFDISEELSESRFRHFRCLFDDDWVPFFLSDFHELFLRGELLFHEFFECLHVVSCLVCDVCEIPVEESVLR